MAAVCLGALFLAGNAPGGDDLHHHNWWNYYERGVARLEENRPAEAAEDFERCLDLRRGAKFGYPEDLWRARTYGLHFLEGYFPNREYGVCLFLLGETEKAVRYLDKSLRQAPSGRAKHYVNLARARLLESAEVPPPVIELDDASQIPWTRERRRTISGVARGKGYVSDVMIGGERQFVELAAQEVAFRGEAALKPGENSLRVTARDLAGQTTERRIQCIADWRPPELVVMSTTRDNGSWRMEASCVDDHALARVEVNGVAHLSTLPSGTGEPVVRLTLEGRGSETLLVRAVDMAGNAADIVVSGDNLPTRSARGPVLWAAARGEGVPDVAQAAAPDETDRMKPSIALSVAGTATEVAGEEFFLDGNAEDPGGLASVRLNGEELLRPEHRGAVRRYFARRIPLDLGTNVITVAVRDLAGNRNEKTFSVTRRVPDHLRTEYRLTIGVTPLGDAGGQTDVAADLVKNAIEMALLSDPARFYLLERDEGWDFILREQELSLCDLSDPQAALRIGKMLPAELLLMGSLLRHGEGLTVYARVVETADGRMLFAEDVYSEGDADDLSYQVDGLVMKIEQRFPLVEARVVGCSGQNATLDAGIERGLDVGASFIVVQVPPGAEDLASGKVRVAGDAPVQLDVVKVRRGKSVARVTPPQAASEVASGDWVYAR